VFYIASGSCVCVLVTIVLAQLVTNIVCVVHITVRTAVCGWFVVCVLQVKSFKEYVELFIKGKEDDVGNPLKCVYESVNPRWEVAVALSDKGFQQMSFVNSIATTKVRYRFIIVGGGGVYFSVDCLRQGSDTGIRSWCQHFGGSMCNPIFRVGEVCRSTLVMNSSSKRQKVLAVGNQVCSMTHRSL
jgi:hypothetical protein